MTTTTIDPDGVCTNCNAYYLECECAWNRPRCRCTHNTSDPRAWLRVWLRGLALRPGREMTECPEFNEFPKGSAAWYRCLRKLILAQYPDTGQATRDALDILVMEVEEQERTKHNDTRPGTVASLALRPDGPDQPLDRRRPYPHWCHICQAATHPDDNDRCPACGWDYGDWLTPKERAESDALGRQMGYGTRHYQGD